MSLPFFHKYTNSMGVVCESRKPVEGERFGTIDERLKGCSTVKLRLRTLKLAAGCIRITLPPVILIVLDKHRPDSLISPHSATQIICPSLFSTKPRLVKAIQQTQLNMFEVIFSLHTLSCHRFVPEVKCHQTHSAFRSATAAPHTLAREQISSPHNEADI